MSITRRIKKWINHILNYDDDIRLRYKINWFFQGFLFNNFQMNCRETNLNIFIKYINKKYKIVDFEIVNIKNFIGDRKLLIMLVNKEDVMKIHDFLSSYMIYPLFCDYFIIMDEEYKNVQLSI